MADFLISVSLSKGDTSVVFLFFGRAPAPLLGVIFKSDFFAVSLLFGGGLSAANPRQVSPRKGSGFALPPGFPLLSLTQGLVPEIKKRVKQSIVFC